MEHRLQKLTEYIRVGWGTLESPNIIVRYRVWINGYVGAFVVVLSNNGVSRKPVTEIWSG